MIYPCADRYKSIPCANTKLPLSPRETRHSGVSLRFKGARRVSDQSSLRALQTQPSLATLYFHSCSYPGLNVFLFGSMRGCHCARKVIAVVTPSGQEKYHCSCGFGRERETGVGCLSGHERWLSKEKGGKEEVLLTPHDVAACEA